LGGAAAAAGGEPGDTIVSRLTERLDGAAGSMARWLLVWATSRRDVTKPSWIHALSAELDHIGTGQSQLAWAVGCLRVLWAEGRASRRSRLRVRLRWVGSAGGLGGLRVYAPALFGSILMVAWSYWHREDDAPIPLLAALLLAPYYALIGLWWGRKRSVRTAALVAAVTALVGFELVTVLTAIQAAATDSASKSVLWLFFGLGFATTVALVGAFCGLAGGSLAHPISTIGSIRRSLHASPGRT
jgi:hypothetical protein